MKYKVITDTDMVAFTEEINKFMQSGWKPCGGIHIHDNGLLKQFYQSMVYESIDERFKYKEEIPEVKPIQPPKNDTPS